MEFDAATWPKDPANGRFLCAPGRHGYDCPKIAHIGGGYLHDDRDDRPYDVDGVWYCGRCHAWLGIKEPVEYTTSNPEAKHMIESARWVCFDCHGEKTVVVPSADFDALKALLRELHDGVLFDPRSYDLGLVRSKVRSALDGGS